MERFWSKVDVGLEDECWEWKAFKHPQGYGLFKWNGVAEYAHQVAWALTVEPLPPKVCVLHKCNNPGCVNPKHLYIGTHTDNARDRRGAGRQPSKLSADEVREMRRLYESGEYSISQLGRAYNISSSAADAAIKGRTWKHVV